jgi:hypothetical protein
MYTRKQKQKHNTICVAIGHHYMQTWALLQTTGGKDEPNIVLCRNGNGHHTDTELRI